MKCSHRRACLVIAAMAAALAACELGPPIAAPAERPTCDPSGSESSGLPPCNPPITPTTPRPVVPAGAQITLVDGDEQVGSAGAVLPELLTVRVTTSGGEPVVGVQVTWQADERGGQLIGATRTDAGGYAQVQRRLGAGTGIRTTKARVGQGAGQEVRFTSIAQIAGGYQMMRHPDDTREDRADTVMAQMQPFRVVVLDYLGAPAPGVPVSWWGEGNRPAVIVPTDQDGVATFVLNRPNIAGEHIIYGAVTGMIGSPVGTRVTLAPGNPVLFASVSPAIEIARIRSELERIVEVRDAYGNTIPDIPVEWSVSAGDGSIHPDAPVTGVTSSGARAQSRAVHRLGIALQQEVTASTPTLPAMTELKFSTMSPAETVELYPAIRWSYYYCYYWGGRYCDEEDPHFSPSAVTIPVGSGVLWVWRNVGCDLLFEDDPNGEYSATTRSYGSHTRIFTEPGVYRFRCSQLSTSYTEGHMIGAVTVVQE